MTYYGFSTGMCKSGQIVPNAVILTKPMRAFWRSICQVESACRTRPVRRITRRALPVLHAETASLCGLSAASLQRYALVVTRQAAGPVCRIEHHLPVRRPERTAHHRTSRLETPINVPNGPTGQRSGESRYDDVAQVRSANWSSIALSAHRFPFRC